MPSIEIVSDMHVILPHLWTRHARQRLQQLSSTILDPLFKFIRYSFDRLETEQDNEWPNMK